MDAIDFTGRGFDFSGLDMNFGGVLHTGLTPPPNVRV
jgi:hypothetical protein